MKIVVVVTYESGDEITTSLANVSDEVIHEYFKVGRVFNIGCVTDRLSAVKKVEIIK